MSFSSLFKKASTFLGLSSPESGKSPPLDGEIIYCKNNVCVHPPVPLRKESQHHPGYMTIRTQNDEVLGSTLILNWIPNNTLKKNPNISLENSPSGSLASSRTVSPRRSPRQTPREEFTHEEISCSVDVTPDDSAGEQDDEVLKHTLKYKDCISATSSENSLETEPSPDSLSGNDEVMRKVSSSLKSQSDSGIGQDEISLHLEGKLNTGGDVKDQGVPESEDSVRDTSLSSDSEIAPTDAMLSHLVKKNKQIEAVKEKERTSSSRSVTSIEMEGDNLVIVTEEMDDDAFVDDGSKHSDPKSDPPSEQASMSSESSHTSPCGTVEHYQHKLKELQNGMTHLGTGDTETKTSSTSDSDTYTSNSASLPQSLPNKNGGNRSNLTLNLDNSTEKLSSLTPDIQVTNIPDSPTDSTGSTSGPDSDPPSPFTPEGSDSPKSFSFSTEIESPGLTYNNQFPENSVSYLGNRSPLDAKQSPREQICGVFTVDLGQMRSLRLFYSDEKFSCGQMVIASRESQYKILHFHHGGLDKLASIFQDWKFFAQPQRKKNTNHLCKQFSVIRPWIQKDQYHPEEGMYELVSDQIWRQHMNELGEIDEDLSLRKAIFFGGLDPVMRAEVWPFLLKYYPFDSTHEAREAIRNDKYIQYQNIRKEREALEGEEKEQFWKSIQCIVEKDVVRTDRSHPYFKGEGNPNIEILKNILLNFAYANPHLGYTQGMSDLLAPVLYEIRHEADAYWCFTGLMQKTIFVTSPKDSDMDKQLGYLRELMRLMVPKFYAHLVKLGDAMDLLFSHRWILLCFKREFPEDDALKMWEACWAHYQTDYFHLFICVAILAVYGDDVVQQDLASDEMLLHFSSLSMHMSGDAVLRKARGLLHKFRSRRSIPCSLHGLCLLCGPGMWDSGHVPAVECTGHPDDEICTYNGQTPTPTPS
ncbi:TBC1 domain family member 16-like [Lineus longissimus]|uniref:TBC1 domain family member 16-like n=1 Tax=Lineus longissimus TaxID=88925 RepID=UPI002B4CB0D4